MDRISGWCGIEGRPDRQRAALEAMAGGSEPDLEGGSLWLNGACGLAVVAGATEVDRHRDDDGWAAVTGPVHFVDPELSAVAHQHGAAAALARGFRERGPDFLECVRGGFSIVIVRPAVGEAFLAIDRVGGRHPLSYRVAGNGLIFGTDGDAIHAHPDGQSDVDPQAIFNYLYFQVVPGPKTARQGVRRLMPGSFLHFKRGDVREGRYWEMVYIEDEPVSVPRLTDELHELLRLSIDRDANGQVGCFLSGGTDSSTVAGYLGRVTGCPAQTFTIGFRAPGYDEMEFARTAARHFSTDQHEYYVTPADVAKVIPSIAAAYSDPFGNASAVPAYFCARMAADDGISRMLAGDGGDELFAGNERYTTQRVLGMYDRVPAAIRSWLVEPLVFGFPAGESVPPVRKLRSYIRQAQMPMPRRMQVYNHLERLGVATILDPDFLGIIDPKQPLSLLEETYRSARAGSMVNRMLAIDLRFTLADNDLPKVSRMCDLAGVAVTYPLLSDEMMDFSRRVPPWLNLKWGRLRWFWKHALRDFLPRQVIQKSKHGFGLPFGLWMRDDAELNEMARDCLRGLRDRRIVRPSFLDELLQLHESEHAAYYGAMIWILIMLEHWFRAHVDPVPEAV